MSITVFDLQNDLDKYLRMAENEDIFITREGRIIAKLSNPNPNQERIDIANSLFGIISNDVELESAKEERLGRI